MQKLFSDADKPQDAGRPLQNDREPEGPNLEALRIMIVDDEFFVAWHLQSLLEDLGYAGCEIASDSLGAIALAEKQDANLILMDVNLGGEPDGVETVRRILEVCDVKVIFITAYTDEDNLRRIHDVKSDAPILSKPASLEMLRSAIAGLFPPA